jgi:hypothetical protein
MDSTTLARFRHHLYTTGFTRARDTLWDVADALLTHPQARSFIELSQATSFQRQWPSLYEALEDGRIDRDALRGVFAAHLPGAMVGERLVLGRDVSSILRPDAHTSADRTLVHRSNLPADATPVGPGWQFSSLVVLPDPVSAATDVLDTQRIPSTAPATTVGAAQLRAVLPLLAPTGVRVLLVLDRGSSNTPWLLTSQDVDCDRLIRARNDQVLYRPAPPRTPRAGRPRCDGARFKGSAPETHGDPDDDWSGTDTAGHPVRVTCWRDLHLKQARHIPITVIRVVRAAAQGTKRNPRIAWFWWIGGPLPPLAAIPQLYGRRFGHEHGFRLDKQALLWNAPRLRTPEQFERWTDLVSCVHNQLVLMRPLVTNVQRPWERRTGTVSVSQVRRGAGKIVAQLGTPARPPQRRGNAPGRAAGTTVRRASRHPVIRKGTKTTSKTKKTPAKQVIQRE